MPCTLKVHSKSQSKTDHQHLELMFSVTSKAQRPVQLWQKVKKKQKTQLLFSQILTSTQNQWTFIQSYVD